MHSALFTLDSHIDIPWPDRGDFEAVTSDRQVDLVKLRAGGMKVAVLAAYVPQTMRDDESREAAWARVQAMLRTINALESPSVSLCATTLAIVEAINQRRLAIIPAVENGHALGGQLDRIAFFKQMGVRYMTLTHNGHNDLADSAIAVERIGDDDTLHNGLSAMGRQAIKQLNTSGILIDVSHASKRAMLQSAEVASLPVIASHSCARALCNHPRNLDDEQLYRLRDSGGVVQITAVSSFLKPISGGHRATVDDFAKHVSYVASLIGVDHVGVSSDFDGGGGIDGWQSANQSGHVTEALMRQGHGEAELKKIWGGNFMRVLEEAEA